MPIVAAAVVPHSPLLLPTVAKDHAPLLAATTNAMNAIAELCYAAQPEVMILLTPHGESHDDTIVINAAETYRGNFTEFGDLTTTVTARGALGVVHQLKTVAEREHLPLVLQTAPELDYGTTVPLTLLQSKHFQLPIIPISLPYHTPELLLRTGGVLHDFLSSANLRSMIIASADMTRRKERTPATHRRPTTEERQLSAAIVAVDPAQATAVKPQTSTCGFGPIVTLLSTLDGLSREGKITSFEAPLGVGLLTATFTLST